MGRCNSCRWAFTALSLAISVIDARADLLISDFATTTADSAQTNRLYGIRAVGNSSSVTKVLVKSDSTGNFLRLNASKIASEGTEGYSAEVGVVLPLDASAKERDLAGLVAISFEYRISAPVTDLLVVSLESGVYSQNLVQAGTIFEDRVYGSNKDLAIGSWKSERLELLDFSTPSWWTAPAGFPTIEEVLTKVSALRFSPRTTYTMDGTQAGIACTKCVGPTMASQILDIRNVKLIGYPLRRIDTEVVVVPPPPPPPPAIVDSVGYLLSDYAVAALDSAKTNAVYGIQSAANPASQATATVPGGFVRLDAPLIASEPNYQGYSAYVGLIHPIFPDWHAVDLSQMTGLSFEFRNTNMITDRLLIAMGSNAYTHEQQYAGTIYQDVLSSRSHVSPSTNWKSVWLDVRDLATPSWWIAPANFPTIDSVLRQVHSLQFVPQSAYVGEGVQNGKPCTKCVGPTMTKQTLEIRNIRLKNVLFPNSVGGDTLKDRCSGSKVIALDDFQDGNNKNLLGGSWYSYSDADPEWVESERDWGSSSASLLVVPGAATLDASLNKKLGDVWHAGAGWAGMETFFGEGVDLEGLTGIQFQISTQLIDPNTELALKVFERNVPDSQRLSVPLKTGTSSICVTPENLKPPKGSTRSSRLDPSNILALAWEAKIQDQTHPFIDQSKARFTLQNVKLFGADPDRLSRSLHRKGRQAFSVSYSQGELKLEGLEGLGQVEIRNLQGKTVASFAASSRVPVQLGGGTYILSVKRNGMPLTKSFAVMGR